MTALDTPVDPAAEVSLSAATWTVALAGNPNVGKTTLFNALTGLKQKVANYPGVTVEKKEGRCELPGPHHKNVSCALVDLPGTYSLASRSPDEHVARGVLLGQIAGTPRPDVIVVVCDASNLERNLYLVTQVLEVGRPVVVALTMCDLAQQRGQEVDPAKLSRHLGVPVVPVQGHRGVGIVELKKKIAEAIGTVARPLRLALPSAMELHVQNMTDALLHEKLCEPDQAGFDAHLMLSATDEEDVPDLRLRNPRVAAALHAAHVDFAARDIDPVAAEIEAHYAHIGAMVEDCVAADEAAGSSRQSVTDKIDRIVTHKFWGMLIFLGVMGLVFVSIFSWAQPIMDFLQYTLVGGLGEEVRRLMAAGPLRNLIVDGIIAGVGNVIAFLPQIILLFLFLAALEDSGYMSRAAFLMDRLMSKVGLHGKSFIPLLSGFACAVPAIMGTRVIENKRDRLATILVLPLMSCSARLPIYTLMIGTFFAAWSVWAQGTLMLIMYLLGTVSAFAIAWIFKRTLLKGPAPAFILEMPPYRMPHWKTVLQTVGQRTWQFLKRAGTIIFALSVLMWAATHYPRPAGMTKISQEIAALKDRRGALARAQSASASPAGAGKIRAPAAQDLSQIIAINRQIQRLRNAKSTRVLNHSLAGHVGKFIAPVFYPLGFDWKTSIGVVGAFFARETMISTMGIIYSVGQNANETNVTLKRKMLSDRWPADSGRAGQPVFTQLSAISLMVFFVYCMQCLSTLAIVKRETGKLSWAVFMFVYMTGLAYVAALVVYQVGAVLRLGLRA